MAAKEIICSSSARHEIAKGLNQLANAVRITLGPRQRSNFPYQRGKRRPFRYTPAGISRRAQTIVERVKAARS